MAEMKTTLKDGRTVNLVSLTPEDTDRLHAMLSHMPDEALRWSMAPYTPDIVQRWFDNLPNLIYLAVEDKDMIVCQATIHKFTHPRMRGVAILGIFLHQDYQNVGLGTAITGLLFEQAKAQRVHKVNLETVADNKIARHLFEKLGFEEEGRLRDSYLGVDGRCHDTVLMGKILSAREQ